MTDSINSGKVKLFEEVPIPKAVLTLAVPTVLSSLVMVLYNLADTWFVSMLNDSIQNAAVTLAAPVLLAFNAVNNLFGVGASSLMGRALGSKDMVTVKKSSSFGFWASLVSGILFSVLCFIFREPLIHILGASKENHDATYDYLFWTVMLGAAPSILNVVLAYLVRTEGSSLHASIGTMSGCILNIILDPLFVLPFGLDMGAAGAGLATLISNCVACLYFFILLFVRRKKTVVCISPKEAIPRKAIVLNVCSVGVPAAIQNLLNVTGMAVLNNFTAVFGTDAVAAMGIAYKIHMVPMQISWGVTMGIMPLISYNYGCKNYLRAKKSVFFAAEISLAFLVVVTAGFCFGSGFLMGCFSKIPEVVDMGKVFLRTMSLALPFQCIDFLGVATYQSCGKGFLSLIFAFLRKAVLEIPALLILNRVYPLYGLAWAQTATEFILAFAAAITVITFFRRLLKKKDNK